MIDRSLLVAENDEALRVQLGRAMQKRGFELLLADSVKEAIELVQKTPPAYAVIDLRLDDGDGLQIIDALHDVRDDARAIILSGYANIPTAVAAVKAGAVDYLPKPADADAIEKALLAPDGSHAEPPEKAIPPDEIRLQHIFSFYEQNNGNISETARQLGMHRRTLQRILHKNPVQ